MHVYIYIHTHALLSFDNKRHLLVKTVANLFKQHQNKQTEQRRMVESNSKPTLVIKQTALLLSKWCIALPHDSTNLLAKETPN